MTNETEQYIKYEIEQGIQKFQMSDVYLRLDKLETKISGLYHLIIGQYALIVGAGALPIILHFVFK